MIPIDIRLFTHRRITTPAAWNKHFKEILKYRCLGLSIGSKERHSEFNNPLLSSGGLTFSGNARSVPQVRIGIPEYTLVPGTKGWLAFKGHIAYGMFTDDGWQKDFVAPGGKSIRERFILFQLPKNTGTQIPVILFNRRKPLLVCRQPERHMFPSAKADTSLRPITQPFRKLSIRG